MTWLRKGKPLYWVIVLAWIGFGLELGAYPVLGIRDAGPCLLLALIVSVSLCRGHTWGIPLALVLGLMADSLTGWGLGLHMLTFSLTAIVCSLGELRLNADALWMAPALSAGAAVVSRLIGFGMTYVSRVPVQASAVTLFHLAVSMLLTGAVSLLLHLILYRRLQPMTEDRYGRSYRTYR